MVNSLGGTGKGFAGSFAPATSPIGVSATTGRKPFFTNSLAGQTQHEVQVGIGLGIGILQHRARVLDLERGVRKDVVEVLT